MNKRSAILCLLMLAGLHLCPIRLRGAAIANIGANIESPLDYAPSQMFADIMKQARHWGGVNTPWDEAAPEDANGWPTGDAAAVFMVGIPHMGGQTYKLSLTGNATVSLVARTDSANSRIQNQVYNAGTNTTTADIVLGANETNLMLSFQGQAGGVKNVKLLRPGHQPSELFNRDFLARLKYFTTLRFMDYSDTNNNPTVSWSDRVVPANATMQKTPAGMSSGAAWEYIVLLANVTGKDIWINVPHQVLGTTYQFGQTDYVTKLAQLLKYGSDGVIPYTSAQANPVYPPLNPGLKIYVEYSNEMWNGLFSQERFIGGLADSAIAARDPDLDYDSSTNHWTVHPRVMAKGIMQISDIFRSVFGDADMMARVRPVLAAQFTNAGTYSGLSYLDAKHLGSPHYLYAIAGAPYIDIADESSPTLTLDQIFTEMTTYNTTTIASSISNLKATAQAHGVRFVAYEGGQTLYPVLGNVANKLGAQTDPRMKAETLALLNNWAAAGGDLFNYYSLCSGWGTYGYWGLSNDITYDIDADSGYPNSERFPKWGAIKQFVAGTPPPPPLRRRVVRSSSGR